jgi:hypothetical protein
VYGIHKRRHRATAMHSGLPFDKLRAALDHRRLIEAQGRQVAKKCFLFPFVDSAFLKR